MENASNEQYEKAFQFWAHQPADIQENQQYQIAVASLPEMPRWGADSEYRSTFVKLSIFEVLVWAGRTMAKALNDLAKAQEEATAWRIRADRLRAALYSMQVSSEKLNAIEEGRI